MARARRLRDERFNALSDFMRRPEGRAYIYDFLAGCHVYSTTFSESPTTMAFREGERNVGLKLLQNCVQANADAYLLMLKEAGNVRSTPNGADTDTDGADTDGADPDELDLGAGG